VLCEESIACDIRLDVLDMDWLRRQYSILFDRAAQAVFRAGYDLDDVIVERFVSLVDEHGDASQVPASALRKGESESDRVPRPDGGRTSAGAGGSPGAPGGSASSQLDASRRIQSLFVSVVLERWPEN
jgi:hypothetical protein